MNLVASVLASSDDGGGGAAAFFLVALVVVWIIMIVAGWKVFEKAGEAGWKTIIPFYNYYTLLKIVGRPWWWLLVYFIPIIGFITLIIVANDVSKSFGKSTGFTVGLVLLPFIFVPILGFGDAQYRGPAAAGGQMAMAGGTPPPPPPPAVPGGSTPPPPPPPPA